MILKHKPLAIPENKTDNPFLNCKLDREQYAKVLTGIVNSYADGFVLAINNEWGTGKTTFVKMWQQYLKNQEFETLYFNAWEDDFENEALAAIMAELSTLKTKKTEEAFKKVLVTGSKLVKGAIPIILKAAAAKYLDKDVLSELFGELANNANDLLHSQIQEYSTKKKGLKEFKESLSDFIQKSRNDKPIVFIIDELDRCRPNYAVEVLEKIKHFFDVPGIVFVLSIDKVQLGYAIRGFYGNDNIDANEYLRRFIDVEYSIPEPSMKNWIEYLYDYFNFDEFFQSEKRRTYNELAKDGSNFKTFATILFGSTKTTLRSQEKIIAHGRLVLNSFSSNQYVVPELFVFLIYIKTYYNPFYFNIKKGNYSLQELVAKTEEIIPSEFDNDRLFINVVVFLMLCYKNENQRFSHKKLIEPGINGEPDKLLIKSKLDKSENNENLINIIQSFYHGRNNYSSMQISHFLDKIELTQPFIN